ncbi:hypothetical protein Sjap_007848 [Stephania japonica]|uniref:Uncharacterized protein n=1 Tax=Stephania japonica TaxID=461633 RepID=A0AAP0JNZ9_9MAGN
MAKRGRPPLPKRPLQVEGDPSLNNQPAISNPPAKKTQASNEITAELTTLAAAGSKGLDIAVVTGNKSLDIAAAAGNKSLDIANGTPRRSPRVQNTAPLEVQDVEPICENLEATESDEEHLNAFEKRKGLEETLSSTSMEQKLDKLIQLMGAQARTTEALFSKVSDWCFSTQTTGLYDSRPEMRNDKYKNMNVDSQKKIEDLNDENNELRRKLETALAKLEGYEKGQLVLTQSIDKVKDAFLVSNVTRSTEIVSGLSSAREILSQFAAPTGLTAANRQATTKRRIVRRAPKKGTDKVVSTGNVLK